MKFDRISTSKYRKNCIFVPTKTHYLRQSENKRNAFGLDNSLATLGMQLPQKHLVDLKFISLGINQDKMIENSSNINVDKIVKHWIEKIKNLRTWIEEML